MQVLIGFENFGRLSQYAKAFMINPIAYSGTEHDIIFKPFNIVTILEEFFLK